MNHLTGVLEYTNPRTPAVRSNRFEVKSTQKQSKFVARHTATNHWLAVVSQTFLENPFDHFGINRLVPRFDDAMKCIRDDVASDSLCEELEEACVVTYAYLHARFIMQPLGLKAMRRKYESGVFGMCPRFMCEGQNLLPVGVATQAGVDTVKLFCPRCLDIYESDSQLDGANFGPSFPHFFMQMNRDLKFPRKAEQMQYSFCGVPLDVSHPMCPHRVIRDKSILPV